MQNTDIIYLGIATVSALFGVIMWVRRPQEKSETNDAVFNERMANYEKTTENAVKLALNHSHTVEVKIDAHIKESQAKGEADARWQGRIEALLENLTKK